MLVHRLDQLDLGLDFERHNLGLAHEGHSLDLEHPNQDHDLKSNNLDIDHDNPNLNLSMVEGMASEVVTLQREGVLGEVLPP